VAFFDRAENSPGSLYVRLSTDGSAVQQMTGTRLGSVIEMFAMFGLAFVLGCLFSVPLTLMASLFVALIVIVIGVATFFESQLNERNRPLLQQASAVRTHHSFNGSCTSVDKDHY
jgi:ABC-type bacteriocin/lantibiotic exporter with double-glycine peptidase domain